MRFFWRKRRSDESLDDPLLAAEDGSSETYHQPGELDDLVAKFGRRLLNASPKDISRLRAAVEDDDTEEISEIIRSPNTNTNPTNNESEFSSIDISQDSLFKMAVDECKTEWVKFFLRKIGDKTIPFDVAAAMMKENFNNLWLDYRFLLEDMIRNDVLGWDICTIEVPLETFTVESNLGSRVGTCNTTTEWLEASREGTGLEHWRSLNSKEVDKLLKTSRERKVNAVVRIYCFENACQIGLDGIVRFLLMHKAPSSLFKSPLLKWVIIFKWERTWKRRAFFLYRVDIFYFSVSFIAFTLLPVSNYAYRNADSFAWYVTGQSNFIFRVSFLALYFIVSLFRGYLQLRRYIWDGQKISPSKRFRGFVFYLRSFTNMIDLTLVGLIAFSLIRTIRLQCGAESDASLFSLAPAILVLLLWAQILCRGSAMLKRGICGVTVARVLKECLPYFFLLLQITMAFGSAMTAALVEYWLLKQEEKDVDSAPGSPTEESDKDKESELESSFGNQYRSTLNMAYAIVGLFDPEVLFEFGSMHWFIIILFLLYLLIQSILMFNILIASMGDAYDGVKAAEEELFLMARARFMDQFEAELRNKSLQKMKAKIGKYLYVLMPEDKELEENAPFWKGRIPTIKEDVKKIVTDSQNQMSQRTSEMFRTLMDEIKGFKDDIKDFNDNIKRVEGRIMTLEKRISDQESNQ